MKKLSLLFCLISTALFSQPVLTGRQGGTGVANTNKTITLGSSLSWPANGSGILNNDGSGNLSWGSAGASTFTINSTAMSTGNSYTIQASTTNSLNIGTGLSLSSGTAWNGATTNTLSLNASASNLTNGTTGTNSVVLSTGATVNTPTITSAVLTGTATALGTPASGTLTNCTGLPVAGTLLSVSAPLTLSTNTLAVTTVGTGSVALQGAVTSYTPTWTSAGTPPSIGNGSITGYYVKVGNKVDAWIAISTGSTTTFGSSNVWTFTLPTTANNNFYVGGSAIGLNAGVAVYSGAISATSTTVFSIGGPNTGNFWMSTIPGTWGGAGSSYLKIHVTYFE